MTVDLRPGVARAASPCPAEIAQCEAEGWPVSLFRVLALPTILVVNDCLGAHEGATDQLRMPLTPGAYPPGLASA